MDRSNIISSSDVNYSRGMIMKHLLLNLLNNFRWAAAIPIVCLSYMKTNKIRKFFTYFITFCVGFGVLSFLLYSRSLAAGEEAQLMGVASRRRPSMDDRPKTRTTVEQQLQVTEQQTPTFHREQQRRRRRVVSDTCKKLNYFNRTLAQDKTIKPSNFSHIFVDDNRRFLYCAVPKVACSNWKRILLLLTGKMNTTRLEDISSPDVHGSLQKTYLRRLSDFPVDEIQQRIDTYFKFMFVREPFERVLSAYHNKFVTHYNKYFKSRYGRRIVKNYRKNPTNESLRDGHDVTFEEFVAYLLDPRTTRYELFEPHWRPFYQLCHPCLVRYDLIGKYETMTEDADWTLSELGVREIVRFPTADPRRVRTADLVAAKFANISDTDIHRLWRVYSTDFAMFGYPYPSYLMKGTVRPRTSPVSP